MWRHGAIGRKLRYDRNTSSTWDGGKLRRQSLSEDQPVRKKPIEDFRAQVAVGRKEIGAFRQTFEYRAGLDDCATVVDHQRRDNREPANLAEVWQVSVASSQIQSNALVRKVELRQQEDEVITR